MASLVMGYQRIGMDQAHPRQVFIGWFLSDFHDAQDAREQMLRSRKKCHCLCGIESRGTLFFAQVVSLASESPQPCAGVEAGRTVHAKPLGRLARD
jgi:hypothetical protein